MGEKITKFLDITGKKYNMLTAIKRVKRPRRITYTGAWWLVKCDCGREKIMRAISLRTKNTKSCGCSTGKLMRKARLLEKGLSQKRRVFTYYKTHAKKLGVLFKLDFDKFIEITQQNCYYCRTKPSNIQKSKNNSGNFIYNGIDRKNNNLGYSLKNSVPCCKSCNVAKNNRSEREFYLWIENIIKNRKIKWKK